MIWLQGRIASALGEWQGSCTECRKASYECNMEECCGEECKNAAATANTTSAKNEFLKDGAKRATKKSTTAEAAGGVATNAKKQLLPSLIIAAVKTTCHR